MKRLTEERAVDIIACAMAARGMTQAQLADKTAIHRSKVSEILNGKRRPYYDEIERMAHAVRRPLRADPAKGRGAKP